MSSPSSSPEPSNRFDRDTALTEVSPGVFDARIDPGWWIVRGPNGGYLNAILLRAMRLAVDDESREPRSLTTHFTSPPAEGPARVTTHIARSGRSLSTVEARMEQDGQLVAIAIAAVARGRDKARFQDLPMPEVGPPPTGTPPERTGMSEFRNRFETHPVFAPAEPDPGNDAVTGGWIRPADARAGDALLLAQLADAWPPAIFSKWMPGAEHRGVPTIDLTVHFRNPEVTASLAAGSWYLVRFQTRVAESGFIEEDGEIWSEQGVLLANSRQLAIMA